MKRAWVCWICDEAGTVPESVCTFDFKLGLRNVETGNHKKCPGCDGSGVSKRAELYRQQHPDWQA